MFRKIILSLFLVVVVVLSTACSNNNQEGISPTNETTTETTTEATTEQDAGWRVEGDTLYITRIDYAIVNSVGAKYIYDTPWSRELLHVDKLKVEAYMNYLSEYKGMKSLDPKSVSKVNNIGGLFSGFAGTEASITINMNGVKDASMMLSGCNNLVNAVVSLSGDVEDCSRLFALDKKLVQGDISISANVKNVSYMYYECESLINPSVSIKGTVDKCSDMFNGCKSITRIDIPFSIKPDTMFLDMFNGCSSLTSVNFGGGVEITRKGSTFFDGNNSIEDFSFANSWKVPEGANPIGQSLSTTMIVPIPGEGDYYIEYVFFLKTIPEWYHDYTKKIYSLDSMLQVFESDVMDVYVSQTGGSSFNEEVKQFDVWNTFVDSIIELGDGPDAERAAYIKDKVDKGIFIASWAKAISQ